MRIYTVHDKGGPTRNSGAAAGEAVPMKEGFSWPACVFSVLWALWYRLWLAALVFFLANSILSWLLRDFGADGVAQAVTAIALALIIGWTANDFRRRKLSKQGYRESAVVIASNKDSALQRYFDSQRPSTAPVSRAGGPW
ncbi:MAG: hypothetical protein CMM74_00780 [Rhodospirillaceae bacterium]|nr:hypothetical protein [Rhodospirillaceae bacterium]